MCHTFFAQAALAEGDRSAKTTRLRHQLRQHWRNRSLLIQESFEPEINLSPEHLFETGACFDYGQCVCGQAGDSGPHALAFHASLVRKLKLLCWSKPKQKKKSTARRLLEEARIVLALKNRANKQIDYIHLCFLSYSSWKMTVLPLYDSGAHPRPQRKLLVTSELCETAGIPLRSGDFEFSVCFFDKYIDFSCEYAAALYEIDDDFSVRLTTDENKSGYVQVLEHSSEFTVWLGSEVEATLSRSARQGRAKRPQGPARDQGVKRPPKRRAADAGKKARRGPVQPNLLDQIDEDMPQFSEGEADSGSGVDDSNGHDTDANFDADQTDGGDEY